MYAPVTQIYVASQSARELIVVDRPYTWVGAIFIVLGLLIVIIGYASLYFTRSSMSRPVHWLFWLIPLIVAIPMEAIGLGTGAASTKIHVSVDDGTMHVRKTVLSVPLRSQSYPLGEIRDVRVGVGDVCRFLYVNLNDGRSDTLLGCTDRKGYSEAADAINGFLKLNHQ
jgi:hypothetical protein